MAARLKLTSTSSVEASGEACRRAGSLSVWEGRLEPLSDAEIARECRWILGELGPDVPLHFSAFHPDFRMMDVPPTPAATLRRARAIALAEGIRYAYTGNVHDREGDTTRCPCCGAALVQRDWYRIEGYRLTEDGRCPDCGTAIPGRWQAFDIARQFGPRRIPVAIGGAA